MDAWDNVLRLYCRRCKTFQLQQLDLKEEDSLRVAHRKFLRVLVVGNVPVSDAGRLLNTDVVSTPIPILTERYPCALSARDASSPTLQLSYRKCTLSKYVNRRDCDDMHCFDIIIFQPIVEDKRGRPIANLAGRMLRAVTYLDELLSEEGAVFVVLPGRVHSDFLRALDAGSTLLGLVQERADSVISITRT